MIRSAVKKRLLSSIPRDRRRSYDVRRILGMIVDRDSFFEIGKYYGRPLVAGLARLNGYPIGVMANDPRKGGGAVDAAASEKMIRFIDLCDTFHLPVVNFVDNPGFLIGTSGGAGGNGAHWIARFGRGVSGDGSRGSRSSFAACSAWRAQRMATPGIESALRVAVGRLGIAAD
jgi:hypothetical protein